MLEDYLGAPWGSGIFPGAGLVVTWDEEVRYLTEVQENMEDVSKSTMEMKFQYTNLSTLDCLTRYLTYTRDASNLLLVSSIDALDPSTDLSKANSSLLVFGWYGSSWQSISAFSHPWECGSSNSFSCVLPQTWEDKPKLVADWNIYGYKIDYCLSKTASLENRCSIQFELRLMIGAFIAGYLQWTIPH